MEKNWLGIYGTDFMKILNYVLCEDIRPEIGSKLALLGVFHDKILFRQDTSNPIRWPIRTRLSFYLKILFEKNDIFETLTFSITEKNTGNCIFDSGAGEVTVTNNDFPIPIYFNIGIVQISSPTTLILKIIGHKGGKIKFEHEPPFQYNVVVQD